VSLRKVRTRSSFDQILPSLTQVSSGRFKTLRFPLSTTNLIVSGLSRTNKHRRKSDRRSRFRWNGRNCEKRSKQSRQAQTTPVAHRLVHEPKDDDINSGIRGSSTELRSSGSEGSFAGECLTLHLSSLHKSEHFCEGMLSESALRQLLLITTTFESTLYLRPSRRSPIFENETNHIRWKSCLFAQ